MMMWLNLYLRLEIFMGGSVIILWFFKDSDPFEAQIMSIS